MMRTNRQKQREMKLKFLFDRVLIANSLLVGIGLFVRSLTGSRVFFSKHIFKQIHEKTHPSIHQ